MQFADHLDRERPAPIQNLGHPSTTPEVGFEISACEAAALHVVQQRFDGIRWFDRLMLGFVAVD